jgi:RimJ/RimL family protein N-acetyltransferase
MLARNEAQEAIVLRTRRLVLEPLAPPHAPGLAPLLDDWEVVRMLAIVPWPLPAGAVAEHARAHAEGRSEADEFAILRNGAPIGVAALKRPGTGDPPRKMPRLGYWLGRPHWGRGYATEALAALVAYAFAHYPAERIGAGVFTDNPASRRVLEKLGFVRVGGYPFACRARAAMVDIDDMNLTRAAWAAGATQ